jgi:hypothetical protein
VLLSSDYATLCSPTRGSNIEKEDGTNVYSVPFDSSATDYQRLHSNNKNIHSGSITSNTGVPTASSPQIYNTLSDTSFTDKFSYDHLNPVVYAVPCEGATSALLMSPLTRNNSNAYSSLNNALKFHPNAVSDTLPNQVLPGIGHTYEHIGEETV